MTPRAAQGLARILAVWGLSQAEAARVFGVSREAVGKWLASGVPSDRAVAITGVARRKRCRTPGRGGASPINDGWILWMRIPDHPGHPFHAIPVTSVGG